MKPILVLQHCLGDGPGYLATWLRVQGLAFEVFNTAEGQDFPATMAPYAALAVLGGAMSANDDLPSLRQAERLILEAMMHQQPVIGHCLGGQLMARALGARVHRMPRVEVGWHAIELTPPGASWFDEVGPSTVFEWHRDGFHLPPGAENLAYSPDCPHQAFALGPHLGLQFHLEMDEPKLRGWAHDLQTPLGEAGVQALLVQSRLALPQQQRLANRLYRRWLQTILGTDSRA